MSQPDYIECFEHIALVATVGIVLCSHLLELLDRLLGWPHFLVDIVRRRRKKEVEDVLAELGISAELRAAIAIANRNHNIARYNDPTKRAMTFLRTCFKAGTFRVGTADAQAFPYFVDVMSESLTTARSDECAYIITSYVKSQGISINEMDIVVGIKQGAPAIAISIAEKLGKPVALFRGSGRYKYNAEAKDPVALFDGVITAGASVVIVDDSTTGGKMAIDCIAALRSCGCTVSQFWVVFEPIGKGGRELLKAQQVDLHSVVKMTDLVISELSKS